jgi:hypothetical protein
MHEWPPPTASIRKSRTSSATTHTGFHQLAPARAGIHVHQDYDNAVSAGETQALMDFEGTAKGSSMAAPAPAPMCHLCWSDFLPNAYLL